MPKNLEQEAQELIAQHGEQWRKDFACLDSLSGRPSLQKCVEQALSHASREKYQSLKVWAEIWLQNAAKQWMSQYFREKNAAPTDLYLNPEVARQKLKDEEDRRKAYLNAPPKPLPEARPVVSPQYPAELQEKLDKLEREREPGFMMAMWGEIQKHEAACALKPKSLVDSPAQYASQS